MPAKLKELELNAIALVDRGANQLSHIKLWKRAEGAPATITAPAGGTPPKPEEAHVPDTPLTDLDQLRKDYAAQQAKLEHERTELQKQLEARTAEVKAHEEEVLKIRRERRREQFIKRVQQLSSLPGAPADDFAQILDKVEGALTEQEFLKLNTMLTSWNTVISKSKVFEEVGREAIGAFTGAEGKLHALTKALQEKEPKLTYPQAYDQVLKAHPEIYREYQAEKPLTRREA